MACRSRALLVLSLSTIACGGSVVPPAGDGARRDGSTVVWPEAGRKDSSPFLQDLTAAAGDPCTFGKCGPNLICMANVCMKMCTQTMPGCNDKVTECDNTKEGCMYASDFTDACYPASAKENEPCDGAKAIFCVGGNLCVKVGTKAPKCLRLCKYGCPSGTQCGKTNNNCSVCIPP